MQNISERYRLKALACEKIGRDAPNKEFRSAWAEIAIEWHALSANAVPAGDRGGQVADILKSWPINEVRKLIEEIESKLYKPS
jgi:hypothetical protein